MIFFLEFMATKIYALNITYFEFSIMIQVWIVPCMENDGKMMFEFFRAWHQISFVIFAKNTTCKYYTDMIQTWNIQTEFMFEFFHAWHQIFSH